MKNVNTTLIIAYYNLGVQYEFLNDYDQAILHYRDAIAVSKNDTTMPIIQTIYNNINEIKSKITSRN